MAVGFRVAGFKKVLKRESERVAGAAVQESTARNEEVIMTIRMLSHFLPVAFWVGDQTRTILTTIVVPTAKVETNRCIAYWIAAVT